MDWNMGYTARYYMTLIDPITFLDTDRFDVTGGTVKHESTNLRTAADIDCIDYTATEERIVRVWLDAVGETDSSHTALFTGYTSSPDRNIEGTKVTNSLQCYSVLLPAADTLLEPGWYAPVEADGLVVIRSLLRISPFNVEFGEPNEDSKTTLTQSIVAEQGETHLSMVDKILAAINWLMWVDGMGTIHIDPYSEQPVASFDAVDYDMIETSLTVSYNWFDCPNCIRVTMDDRSEIAKDIDSDTPMSIQNRGREVWYEETDVNLNEGETLKEYAIRRLKELQRVSTTINYDRRFDSEVHLLDVVTLNYPRQEISGNFLITSQSISLGFNAKTSEEVIAV